VFLSESKAKTMEMEMEVDQEGGPGFEDLPEEVRCPLLAN